MLKDHSQVTEKRVPIVSSIINYNNSLTDGRYVSAINSMGKIVWYFFHKKKKERNVE
jgi:hypothetical protein